MKRNHRSGATLPFLLLTIGLAVASFLRAFPNADRSTMTDADLHVVGVVQSNEDVLSTRITIEEKFNVWLKDIFSEIEKQAKITIDSGSIENVRLESVMYEGAPVSEILRSLSSALRFNWRKEGENKIVLTPR